MVAYVRLKTHINNDLGVLNKKSLYSGNDRQPYKLK